jgi:hypothetical protein
VTLRVVDPGHVYRLQVLDGGEQQTEQTLTFVKREGAKYPGNVGHHPGTNLQEVLRACLDRLQYLDTQIPCAENKFAQEGIKTAIMMLESRAANRHERTRPLMSTAIYGKTCVKCGHVGCNGECHAQNG